MSAGAAGRTFDSAFPRDESLTEGCVRCSEDEKTQRESTSSSVEIEGTCVAKNLEETVRLQSEKRGDWIRERLQEIAESASGALCLASSSAASFPERNECPGTHCRLTEQEEREDSSCQKD